MVVKPAGNNGCLAHRECSSQRGDWQHEWDTTPVGRTKEADMSVLASGQAHGSRNEGRKRPTTGPDTCVAEDALWRRKRERGPADEGRPSHRNGRASEQGGAEADQLASELQPAEHVPTARTAPTRGGRNKGRRGT
ncbi:uncharacterized protein PITG_07050 [Phytophthora infestans T30-4]|uniref:Uncharacterized protein n=1 Tax=Phytophthora infestans (strain T30-4) TaxID=403677 RepID=D0N749_PHYIT|nr:uncharacterized protein PITG_07050 [Phytophthora infestans T30-4]EEY53398.1 conserved hypothetical protein [Phytophthora infestans T30-4]|eukprot:XP_002905016.1 conserved hypothetical protein [Phytophthora infestans T30-4]